MRAPLWTVAATALALGVSACGGGSPVAEDPDLAAGKTAYLQKCAACHALEEAGAQGTLGPDLDDAYLEPRLAGWDSSSLQAFVLRQIHDPTPPMPEGLAEGEEAANIAAYVAAVAGVRAAGRLEEPAE